jgi:hypothetical protein
MKNTQQKRVSKAVDIDPPYAKYDAETRLAIGKIIRKEWEKMKGELSSADGFISHIQEVLTEEGFKSPIGKALTPRTVRYQVFRNGIRFRKTDRSATPVMPATKPIAVAAASPEVKRAVVQDGPAVATGMSSVLMSIMTDASLSPAQREALIKAYYGVK